MSIQKAISSTLLSTLITGVTVGSAAYAATSPSSISREISQEVNGEKIALVRVKCGDDQQLRSIIKKDKTRKWCLEQSPEKCFSKKIVAAQKVCATPLESPVASNAVEDITTSEPVSPEPIAEKIEPVEEIEPVIETPQPEQTADIVNDAVVAVQQPEIDVQALRKEKIELEAKRISIQSEKLELYKEEILLQKKLLEYK